MRWQDRKAPRNHGNREKQQIIPSPFQDPRREREDEDANTQGTDGPGHRLAILFLWYWDFNSEP
jgi:hypothetical protein